MYYQAVALRSAPGWPAPRVTWWLENALVDDTSERAGDGKVQNVLRLERLERKQLLAVYTCQAANNQLAAPVSTAITLDMNRECHCCRPVKNTHISLQTFYFKSLPK